MKRGNQMFNSKTTIQIELSQSTNKFYEYQGEAQELIYEINLKLQQLTKTSWATVGSLQHSLSILFEVEDIYYDCHATEHKLTVLLGNLESCHLGVIEAIESSLVSIEFGMDDYETVNKKPGNQFNWANVGDLSTTVDGLKQALETIPN